MKKKEKPKPIKPKKEKCNAMDHWKGMPEYNQEGLKPVKQLKINLLTVEDMHKFSKLVGQPITAKTISIWYPAQKIGSANDKRWVDKSI